MTPKVLHGRCPLLPRQEVSPIRAATGPSSILRSLRARPFAVLALFTAIVMFTTLGGLATVGIWSTHPFGAGKGGAPSIVVDSRGQAHIFVPWGQLRYYTTAGGQWAEYVLPETDFVFHGSIAIDREDRLHVAYATAKVVDNRIVSNTTLRYATNRAGDWSFQTVDSEGFDPSLAAESIAVDSTGNARLSYSTATLEGSDYYLTRKYAARVGEVWKIDELELYPYAIWSHGGAVTGIGVDAQGRPHIVYAFDSFTMGYATNRTGSWEFALIPTIEGSSDLSAPIALDSMDRVHIAFFRDREVVHAVREGAGWRNETIEQTGGIGARSISLTIDRSDTVHIGFVNRDLAQVVYVTNSGGSWKSTIVDRSRDAPYGTSWVSIAVGPDARPRMVYNLDSDRKYATTSVDLALLADFTVAAIPYLLGEAVVAVTAAAFVWRSSRKRRAPRPAEGQPES